MRLHLLLRDVNKMRAKLIARVSTEKQDGDLRMRELRNYARIKNHVIVAEYWIYESATIELEKRKEFMTALEEDKGEELIIVNKLDRITRNFKSISWFEEYFANLNAKIIALDFEPDFETAIGRYMFRQLLLLAVLEAEQIKERAKPKIEERKKEGKYKGRLKGAIGKKNPNYVPPEQRI